MSFRKRNEIVSSTNTRGPPKTPPSTPAVAPTPSIPGIRPSPVNGQPTTSTGTPSLDSLLAGHAGLPLGCSLLIEEPGTTDYGGALLRYYAAEGIVQGHAVTVIGVGEHWVRELPGVIGSADVVTAEEKKEQERMKIAWRYERLGDFGSGIGGSRAQAYNPASSNPQQKVPFCHTFDLTKRLTIPSTTKLNFVPISATAPNPFVPILEKLYTLLSNTPPNTPHRIIIPSLLNPAFYPPHASTPTYLLPFIHSLRALLRRYPRILTLMLSLPTELYPRDTGLIRWIEILSDGVLELVPLPRRTAVKAVAGENEPQGLVHLWKLPVLGEKGGGVGAQLTVGEDLAFTVTRRRFEIMAYSLPPADEDDGGGGAAGDVGRATKVDLEF